MCTNATAWYDKRGEQHGLLPHAQAGPRDGGWGKATGTEERSVVRPDTRGDTGVDTGVNAGFRAEQGRRGGCGLGVITPPVRTPGPRGLQ